MELTTSDVYVPAPHGDGPDAGRAAEPGPWPPTVYSPGREARDRALAREVRDALGAASRAGDPRDVTAVARRPGLLRRMARRGAEEAGDRRADAVAAVEGPGLVLAVPVALEADLPLVVLRPRVGPGGRSGEGAESGPGAAAEPAAGTDGGLTAGAGALEPWSRILLVEAVLGGGDALDAAAALVEEAGSGVAGVVVIADLGGDDRGERSIPYNVLSFTELTTSI